MSIEQGRKLPPIYEAATLTFRNFIYAILDSPAPHGRIRIGTLAEDGKIVKLKQGTLQVDRADAQPGQRVVVHET